jgi:hypothetical protein
LKSRWELWRRAMGKRAKQTKKAFKAACGSEDEFQLGNASETSTDEGSAGDTASVAGSAASTCPGSSLRGTRGSSSSAGRATSTCMMPRCDITKKTGSRFCLSHSRHYDNRRYDYEHNKTSGSVAKRKAWVDKCKDTSVAIQEIEDQQSKHAGISKWKQDGKQTQNHAWAEDRGTRASNKSGQLCKPFEKQQFLIQKTSKYGWSDSRALARWNEHINDNYKQDHLGDDGQLRLWLPKEYEDKGKEKYEDLAAQSRSENLKDATNEDCLGG